MRNLFTAILCLFSFPVYSIPGGGGATVAGNAFTAVQNQFFTPLNLLKNPGFENGKAGWTASGGTFTYSTSNVVVATGTASGDWDSNAASQTLSADAVISNGGQGFNSQPYVGMCRIKAASGTPTHTLEIFDGTNVVASTTIQTTTSTWIQNVTPVYTPGTTGNTSLTLRLTSQASNEPEIYVDDCFLGRAQGVDLSQVSQAQFLGAVKITGCAGFWDNTSSTYADFPVQSGCSYATSGLALAPATNIPAIKFATIPPGELILQYEGLAESGSTGVAGFFQFWDGTNTAREESEVLNSASANVRVPGITQSISYTTSQSNITLSIRGKVASGDNYLSGQTGLPGVIKVYFFPSQSQTAYRPDATPASWSGYHNAISGGCSTSSSTYADVSACTSIALTQTTNRNFGTVTTAGSSLPGITFTPPRVGTYQICAFPGVLSSTNANIGVRLVDGSSTVINPGVPVLAPSGVSTSPIPTSVCGEYVASSTASVTAKLQLGTNAGTASIGQSNLPTGSAAIQWTIIELDAAMPTPLLINTVTSNSTGLERVERVAVTYSGGSTPTVVSQSGSWVSSITIIGTGDFRLNIASGEFSAAPSCVCLKLDVNSNGGFCGTPNSFTSTTAEFRVRSAANALENDDTYIICMGPH